mgnify:CR=1 FL=1
MVLFIVLKKSSTGPWKSYYTVQESEYVTQERIVNDNHSIGHRVIKLTIDMSLPTWPTTTELLLE